MSSRLSRFTQLIFGSSAGANQIEQFGSLASGIPVYTTNIATIQALSNYLTGWFGGVVGSNAPAIEDLNALCYLFAYQLAYAFQAGIPEWDTGTPYFIGSFAQDGAGNIYVSLTGSGTSPNLGNALSSTTNWAPYGGSPVVTSVNPAGGTFASPYTMLAADSGKTFLVNTANGAMQFNLPSPALNYNFIVKDSGFNANNNNITMHRHGAENFEGLAADFVFAAFGGEFRVVSDGTNWYVVGR